MNIGLIAGNGQFPMLFSKRAKEYGYKIYATAYKGETDESLKKFVDDIIWLYVGEIKKQIKFFKKHNITSAIMAGGLKKTDIMKNIRPDLKAIMYITKIRNTNDDNALREYALIFEKEGIKIQESTFLLPDLLSKEGFWTKKKPSKSQKSDIEIGFKIAKKIGDLDIGQSIVMNNGSVIAVEAIDGTDSTIKRSGKLSNGNSVVIKICKPNQDFRFDVPAVGIETLKIMKEAKADLLVLEAEKTIAFDKEKMIEFANENNISIIVKK